MINAMVARLPHNWEYVAWIDGDLVFTNPDWVQETIQQLQHYEVVQMFQKAHDLDPNGMIMGAFTGFPASLIDWQGEIPVNNTYYYYGVGKPGKPGYFHPGYAWACTRNAWDTMGGLLDINIVGGGDHQMAHGFFGNISKAIPFQSTQGYRRTLLSWQRNALLLKKNVGFVPGTVLHYWHGKKSRRGYFDRWQILARNEFNPVTDLKRDAYGLWQLADFKIQLRDDLRTYFRQRQEDGIEL
jgi:hypothetical protein